MLLSLRLALLESTLTLMFMMYATPLSFLMDSSITRGVAINYLKLNEQGIFFWGCRDNDKC